MNSQDNDKQDSKDRQDIVVVNGQEFEVIKELKQNTEQTFSRVTVTEAIYHETSNGPHQVDVQPFSYSLESDEQIYTRIMTITDKLQKLDTGWLEDNVSMIHLLNLGDKAPVVRPTEEQLLASQKIVEVLVSASADEPISNNILLPCGYLSPRKSMRVLCYNPVSKKNLAQQYWIRLIGAGSCKLQVTCLPL